MRAPRSARRKRFARQVTAGVLVAAAAGAFVAEPARADETDVCLESHVSAQKARKEGSLLVAHLALQRCERDTCPGPIREECAGWRREIESVLGTVEVSLELATPGDASRARVLLDGAEPLVPLGPSRFLTTVGKHTVEARLEGGPTARSEVMVAPTRVVGVTLDLRTEGDAGRDADAEGAGRPIPPLTIAGAVTTGLGGVGLLTFAIAGGLGAAAYGDLDACRPRCAQSQVDDVDQKLLVADVGLGLAAVGAVLLIVGEVTDAPAQPGPVGFRF